MLTPLLVSNSGVAHTKLVHQNSTPVCYSYASSTKKHYSKSIPSGYITTTFPSHYLSSNMSKKCSSPACKVEDKFPILSPPAAAAEVAAPPPPPPPPPAPKMSLEQAIQLLQLHWVPVKSRPAWERLEEHLPRENFSWKSLPDAVCNEILDRVLFPDGVVRALSHREEFNVAVDLMFLKHCHHEPVVEK